MPARSSRCPVASAAATIEMLEMVEDSVRGLNDEQGAIARAIITAHLYELWAPGEADRLLELCTLREVAEEAGRRLAAR